MSGPRLLFVAAGAGVIAAVAWWQWPRSAPSIASARDAGAAPVARVPDVRKPDNTAWSPADGVALDVRDERGAAAAGALVRATRDGGIVAEAATDDAGRVVLPLTPGRWHVDIADHVVEGAATLELDVPPATPVALVAEIGDAVAEAAPPAPGASPSGVVGVVTAGGARLADFTVAPVFLGGVGPGRPVVNDRIPQPIALPARRYLGTAGAFRWEGLAPGTYLLHVGSPGYGTGAVRVNAIAGGFGDGSIALAPAASLSGTVSDGRAVPIANVMVRATVDGAVVAQARTSSDGIYLLEGLPAGPVVVSVATSKGECTADDTPLTVAAGARTTRRIEMTCAWQGH
ncbi:MAG: carboxypeptidase-like regulatory domain-containing protein [Deltaproteobacteria bacterium]|nr:carboxypeptidase-like regulatory domain-containing protein [Deltaproteobacteria bacterium]